MDYSGAYASHQTMYAPNFGNMSAEHLQQPHYQQHYKPMPQASMSEQGRNPYVTAVAQHQIACDIKPRLTKEQHDILEAHYAEQAKPNTSTKKGFAESLNVSLDKVNNWFQNRRAKSKQDVKKAQSAMHAMNNASQNHSQPSSSGSDSEPSPAYASAEYSNMMQQYSAENNMSDSDSYTASANVQFDGDSTLPSDQSLSSAQPTDQFQNFNFQQESNDLFDSPQDLNRRTLTQEQFNTMQLQGTATGEFNLNMDMEGFNKLFPDYSQQDVTPQAAYDMEGLPLSMPNSEASMPSTVPDQNAMAFPQSGAMQNHSEASSVSSDWGGSRSSSVSTYSRDVHVAQSSVAPQSQATTTTSQWRPGQSVPVDFNQLSQEFRQIAQQQQLQQQQQQQYTHEQPLAWPVDEAYRERRESQTAGITHSMGNVGLKTPQPQQHATFKSPTPSTSLAARRQRSKPAPLGLASMRSQSYSAASQPGSPGMVMPHQQQHHAGLAPTQPLRRIKSSNMVGGVAQGRIQKTTPGSAQRSPLNRTFADAMNSPKSIRQISSQSGSNLAPPTPMSPREQARADAARHMQQWQCSSGRVSRQASISEHDAEQFMPYAPAAPGPDSVSSPPHTPLYPPQPQFAQQRVGKNFITENTPPQSAPATQVSFNSGAFMQPPPPPQSHAVQHPVPAQIHLPQQVMQNMFTAQQPHMGLAEQQFPMDDMSMPHHPQFTLTASDMGAHQMHFPLGGVPMVDANGNLQMAMVQPHYQLVSQAPPMPSASAPPMHYPFPVTGPSSEGLQISAPAPKVAAQPELHVHEYQPPADVKRAATPRKVPVESGPKNYTFANQTPEHFEKSKKANATATGHSSEGNSS